MTTKDEALKIDIAKHTLEHGEKYPFDTNSPSRDWAHKAARGVISDLSDRRGIKQAFRGDDIDADVRDDLVESLATIIRVALNADQQSSAPVENFSGCYVINKADVGFRLQSSAKDALPDGALKLAKKFHETYERLAPSFGYETRPETKIFDPTSDNGLLMQAVCKEILALPGERDNGKENVIQQAQIWAMEAKTQKAIVISILRSLGLPEHDWEAERLVAEKFAEATRQAVPDVTTTMEEAGFVAYHSGGTFAEVFRAMLAAAPVAAQSKEGGD